MKKTFYRHVMKPELVFEDTEYVKISKETGLNQCLVSRPIGDRFEQKWVYAKDLTVCDKPEDWPENYMQLAIPPRLSLMSPDDQILVLKAIAEALHMRHIQLLMQIEANSLESGRPDHYGTSVMTDKDRLLNTLSADFILSDQGFMPKNGEEVKFIGKAMLQDSVKRL